MLGLSKRPKGCGWAKIGTFVCAVIASLPRRGTFEIQYGNKMARKSFLVNGKSFIEQNFEFFFGGERSHMKGGPS